MVHFLNSLNNSCKKNASTGLVPVEPVKLNRDLSVESTKCFSPFEYAFSTCKGN